MCQLTVLVIPKHSLLWHAFEILHVVCCSSDLLIQLDLTCLNIYHYKQHIPYRCSELYSFQYHFFLGWFVVYPITFFFFLHQSKWGSLQVSCDIRFMFVPVSARLAWLHESMKYELSPKWALRSHICKVCIYTNTQPPGVLMFDWGCGYLMSLFAPLMSSIPLSLPVLTPPSFSVVNLILCLFLSQDTAASVRCCWLYEERATGYQYGRTASLCFRQSLVLW